MKVENEIKKSKVSYFFRDDLLAIINMIMKSDHQ